ncbi:MAG: preprotein translocase subunit SecG [Brevundimonas sp.]|uniref:preprotein translocase subunit SecG n=1 Tax=Brevundimonas sp. TaxID=1871086 RepID=UPI00391ACDA1
MLQTILLGVQILISVILIGLILLQRSEGGALGMGGGPSGFMTARGAGNLLSRSTAVMAVLFFICAISLTIVGNMQRGDRSLLDAGTIGTIDLDAPPPAEAPEPVTPAPPAEQTGPTLDDLQSFGTPPAQ